MAIGAYAAVEPVARMGWWSRSEEPPRRALPDPRRTKWKKAFDVVAHKLRADRAISTVADMQRAFLVERVDAVDLDVRAASNGVAVLYHDRSMIKDGSPWPVELFDDGTLRRDGIEALETAYEALPDNKALALDIKKVYGWAGSPRRAMWAVKDMLIAHPERQAKTRLWLEHPADIKEFRQLLDEDAKAHAGDKRYVDVQVGLSRRTEAVAETRVAIRVGRQEISSAPAMTTEATAPRQVATQSKAASPATQADTEASSDSS
jgi:hypothetical protein